MRIITLYIFFSGALCALDHQLFNKSNFPPELTHRIFEDVHPANIPPEDTLYFTKDQPFAVTNHLIYLARQELLRIKQLKRKDSTINCRVDALYNTQGDKFLKIFRKPHPYRRIISDMGIVERCEVHRVINKKKSAIMATILKESFGLPIIQHAESTINWSADGKHFLIAPQRSGIVIFDDQGTHVKTIIDKNVIHAGFTDSGSLIKINIHGYALNAACMEQDGNIIAAVPLRQFYLKSIFVSSDALHLSALKPGGFSYELTPISPNPQWTIEAKMLWIMLYACKKENTPLNFQLIARHNPKLTVDALEGALTRCPTNIQKSLVRQFDIRKSSTALQEFYNPMRIRNLLTRNYKMTLPITTGNRGI